LSIREIVFDGVRGIASLQSEECCCSALGCRTSGIAFIATRREVDALRLQAARSRKEVDILFVVVRYLVAVWLGAVDLGDDRIDHARGQFAADSAIDAGEAERERALDEKFFVDHSVEHSPAHGVIDGAPQIPRDTAQHALVVDTPNLAFADNGCCVLGQQGWINLGFEQAETGDREAQGRSD
jgi:hypothetical protein